MLLIRLPEVIDRRLDSLAARTGRPKSTLAREAIIEYINDLQDHYLAEARSRLDRKTTPLEKVKRKLGL